MIETCKISTRVAVDADLPQIQELYAIWGHSFAYLLNDQTFVAEVDGDIVGAIRLAFEDSSFVVRSLFVHQKSRGQGIAIALLKKVEMELGVAEAYCLPFPEQEKLFSSIGFNPIAGLTAPDFLLSRIANLHENNQDVIMMKRSIGVEVRPLPAKDLPLAMNLIYEFELPAVKKLRENDVRSIYSKIIAAGGAVFGAYRESLIVGTCTLNICANLSWSGRPYGIVENIIVTENERTKGIGKSLLLFARRMAESKNCYKVALMTRQKGPETISFYRSAGFSDDKVSYQRRFSAE
ncbi:MAG: N-acetylglutamate synthase-like GNAT family acetyltransferase [Kiritimatiellia bacterium]|jgi:N-acetylglutamate synthase-like GNAT family acetyltransferase